MNIVAMQGSSVILCDVTYAEWRAFAETLFNEPNWEAHIGWTFFPSDQPNAVMIVLDTDLPRLWHSEIVPWLTLYWGEERMIHEVKFEGDDAK